MAPIAKILLMLFLIITGISMSSNNYIHQFIVTVFYHRQSLATKILRPLGILIALSSVLFITGYEEIGLILNILIGMFLMFCFLRSRNQLRKNELSPREKAIQEYQAEIKAKREYIEQLKLNIEKKKKQELINDLKNQKEKEKESDKV
jgi:hypothetical protein